MTRRRFSILAAAVAAGHVSPARAQFNITVNFGTGLTESQRATFTAAERYWESHIVGYRPAGVTLTGVTISASGQAIDGVGGVLGSAGPTSTSLQGGFRYATAGSMQFDTADMPNMEANGTFLAVILHEMAHVLGFGTLWTNNNLYSNGSGQYRGASALAMWRTEFNRPNDTSVPVELGGGSGTRDGHWNENDGGGGLTGIRDANGNDMRNELMTGWISSTTFVSNTTIQQFYDLGYNVVPVPEPAAALAVAAGLLGLRRLASGRRPPAAHQGRARTTPSSAR